MHFKFVLLFSIIYTLFISTKLTYSYIVIPFKSTNTYEPENNDKENPENLTASEYFMKYYYSNTIYSEISLGTPEQKTSFILSMTKSSFYLGSDLCINKKLSSYYNYDKSNTFKNSTTCTSYFSPFSNACEVKEKMYLYNNTNLESSTFIDSMIMIYGQNFSKGLDDKNVCGILGLTLFYKDIFSVDQRFFGYLKYQGLISKFTWTFQFLNTKNNNYEGYFIAGDLPHEYDNITFNYLDYKSTKVEKREILYAWDIKFHKIYFYNNQGLMIYLENKIIPGSSKAYNYLQGELSIDINYIVTNQEFFNLLKIQFFNDYIANNICISENIANFNNKNNIYEVISCDKTKFEPKKFPKIYLYHLDFNYTFTFDYNELFSEINGKFVFLMTTSNYNTEYWIFGKLFMKKYQFTFDIDNRIIINYLKEKKTDEGKSNVYIYLLVSSSILIVIALIVGIFIGKKLWDKKKKKRANELMDDEYEYKTETSNNSNSDNNNLGI